MFLYLFFLWVASKSFEESSELWPKLFLSQERFFFFSEDFKQSSLWSCGFLNATKCVLSILISLKELSILFIYFVSSPLPVQSGSILFCVNKYLLFLFSYFCFPSFSYISFLLNYFVVDIILVLKEEKFMNINLFKTSFCSFFFLLVFINCTYFLTLIFNYCWK